MLDPMKAIVSVLLAAAALPLPLLPLPASAADALPPPSLTIWINGDKGHQGIREIAAVFTQNTGVPVSVETPDGAPDKFFQAARAGKGPDIMVWAHDRLGEWADAGLLLPVDADPAFTNRIHPKALQAFTHRGRLWGYPIALEAPGLIYNKALVREEDIPAALPDCARLPLPDGCFPILWDYGNTYFTFAFLAANGATIFPQLPDGSYDVSRTDVDSPGAVAALDAIVALIRSGTLPRSLTYSVAEARMNEGRLAMFVSGPFAWDNLRASGIDFGVTLIPGFDGRPARPFVGVVGAMFNRASPNLDLAREFLEHYLITPKGLDAMDRCVPLGVPALRDVADAKAADPLVAGTLRNVEVGLLMPNIPRMGRFWSAMESALSTSTSLQCPPAEALSSAARLIAPPPAQP